MEDPARSNELQVHQIFDRLDQDFQEVLHELGSDDHLEKFRREYEKLYQALKKSSSNEQRLHEKCQLLNDEIVQNASKVDEAMALAEQDQTIIYGLKEELTGSWQMVESSREKYFIAQRTIDSLTHNVDSLQADIEKTNATLAGRDQEIRELHDKKSDWEERRYQREREKNTLEERLRIQGRQLFNEETSARLLQEKKNALSQDVISTRRIASGLRESVLNAQRSLTKSQVALKQVEKEMADLKTNFGFQSSALKQRRAALDAEVMRSTATRRDTEEVRTKISLLKQQIADQRTRAAELERAVQQSGEELITEQNEEKKLQTQIDGVKKEMSRLEVERRMRWNRHQTLQDAHDAVVERIERVEAETALTGEKYAEDQKLIARREHQTRVLQLGVVMGRKEGETLNDEVILSANVGVVLDRKILSLSRDLETKAKKLNRLERLREKFAREASEAQKLFQVAMEAVKIQKLQNDEYQKKIQEQADRLKEQQRRYEQVRIDRNNYSRGLVEANEETAFLKRKFEIMTQEMNHLSEEVTIADRTLSRVRKEKKKLEEETEQLVLRLTQRANAVRDFQGKRSRLQNEAVKLNTIITRTDELRRSQHLKLQNVTSARDILGTQLIRRNDELALLHEKVKIQDATLRDGNLTVTDIKADIRLVRLEVQRLQRDLMLMRKKINGIMKYKRRIQARRSQLVEERKKVQALSEALGDPTRIARWRKLGGSDMSSVEMACKIQGLQKRLIMKTQELVGLEIEGAEQDKLQSELQVILKKQSSNADLSEHLNHAEELVRKQTTQMKTLSSEINMHMYLEKEQSYEIDKLTRELNELKKHYYSMRKSRTTGSKRPRRE